MEGSMTLESNLNIRVDTAIDNCRYEVNQDSDSTSLIPRSQSNQLLSASKKSQTNSDDKTLLKVHSSQLGIRSTSQIVESPQAVVKSFARLPQQISGSQKRFGQGFKKKSVKTDHYGM
jgi:hypothetical protein